MVRELTVTERTEERNKHVLVNGLVKDTNAGRHGKGTFASRRIRKEEKLGRVQGRMHVTVGVLSPSAGKFDSNQELGAANECCLCN